MTASRARREWPQATGRSAARTGRCTTAGPAAGTSGEGAATLPRLFADWVAEYGPEPALARRENGAFTSFTYDEMERRASVLALALATELGVRHGELVALVSDNRPEWLVCSLAIHFLGAVDVPRASDTPPEILEAILRHAEPAVVILEDRRQVPRVRAALPGLRAVVLIDARPGEAAPSGGDDARPPAARRRRARLCTLAELTDARRGEVDGLRGGDRAAPREVAPDDLATIIYTSGTTGHPKGVALPHANYELNRRELPQLLEVERVPVITVLQPWHAYERQMQLMYLSKGCCLHYSSVLRLRGDLPVVRPVVMATVPELWVKLYKGVFLKIDGLKPLRRRLVRWLVARSLTYAKARRLLEGREPVVRPRGPHPPQGHPRLGAS